MALRNVSSVFTRNILQWNLVKTISSVRGLKQITKTEQSDGSLIVSGNFVPSSRQDKLVKIVDEDHNHSCACYMCKLNLDVKHTDVLILSQFLRSDGCMLPKRVTGLCKRQQKRIGTMVTMSQKAGLMMNMTPSYSKKDHRKRYAWKAWNSYWDETTIKC